MENFKHWKSKVVRVYLLVYTLSLTFIHLHESVFAITYKQSNGPSVKHWYGRLGNNIVQIINAFINAKQKHTTVSFPSHPSLFLAHIANKSFTFGPNELPQNIYYDEEFPLHEQISILKEEIIPLLNMTTPKQETQQQSVVIHIRSGDIWDNRRNDFFKWYIQPPIEYYTTILDMHKSISTVVIILDHEGHHNPVAKQLMDLCKQRRKKIITYPKASVEDDFTSLALTQNIFVHSASTFSYVAGKINFLTTTQSIQYMPKFTNNDNPQLEEFLTSKDPILHYNERVKTLLIGGDFGKRAFSLYNNAGNSWTIPRSQVMELYTKPYQATIYVPANQ